jgi:hypothetical protein
MKYSISTILLLLTFNLFSQVTGTNSTTNEPMNTAQNIISGNGGKITVSGYGQIDYNHQFADSVRHNGLLDVHRLITFFGYQFAPKTFFVTEIEMEHVRELYVEQAFVQHNINPFLNFRAGLLLIPMGIVNEYHEPTTFNGVERPNIDGKIIPSTWREMGLGFSGKFDAASLKYQLYLVNGFLSYNDNGEGKLRGIDGFRKGRQKGAESILTHPNLSTKIDYYGIQGLKLGLAGYFGKSQSTAFEGLDINNENNVSQADSTVIGTSMVGLDFRYNNKGFQARGQVIYANNSNVKAYNTFTGNDLGEEFFGYYIEAGYDVFRLLKKDLSLELNLFARYENYDTHHSVYSEMNQNLAFDRTDVTIGAGLRLANGAVLKIDYQRFTNKDLNTAEKHQMNAGVAVWF